MARPLPKCKCFKTRESGPTVFYVGASLIAEAASEFTGELHFCREAKLMFYQALTVGLISDLAPDPKGKLTEKSMRDHIYATSVLYEEFIEGLKPLLETLNNQLLEKVKRK
jgi:hypothetical protein